LVALFGWTKITLTSVLFFPLPPGPLFPHRGGVAREPFPSREGWRLGLAWTPPPSSLSKSLPRSPPLPPPLSQSLHSIRPEAVISPPFHPSSPPIFYVFNVTSLPCKFLPAAKQVGRRTEGVTQTSLGFVVFLNFQNPFPHRLRPGPPIPFTPFTFRRVSLAAPQMSLPLATGVPARGAPSLRRH